MNEMHVKFTVHPMKNRCRPVNHIFLLSILAKSDTLKDKVSESRPLKLAVVLDGREHTLSENPNLRRERH